MELRLPRPHRFATSRTITLVQEEGNKRVAESDVELAPKSEPLFALDLGDNGGHLSPTSTLELTQWLQTEQQFWMWITQRHYGNHEQGFRQAFDQLSHALNSANQSQQHAASNPQHAQAQLESCKTHIQECFSRRKLPHSSTPAARRVDSYRQEVGEQAASMMLGVLVPPDQGHHFQPNDLISWRGLIEALIERYGMVGGIPKGKKLAADQSFEQLRTKAEQLVGTKTDVYNALHRQYAELATGVQATATSQSEQFTKAQGDRSTAFNTLLDEHKSGMEALRKTFREEIALRAPADYWETKRKEHEGRTKLFAGLTFGGMAMAAGVLGWQIHDLLANTPLVH